MTVRILQGCHLRSVNLRLVGGQGHRAEFIQIGNADGDLDAVVRGCVRVAVGVQAVQHRYRHPIGGPAFVIQFGIGQQLAGRGDDAEGFGISAPKGVGKGVVVLVVGRHRRANANSQSRILSHAADACLTGQELWRVVRRVSSSRPRGGPRAVAICVGGEHLDIVGSSRIQISDRRARIGLVLRSLGPVEVGLVLCVAADVA